MMERLYFLTKAFFAAVMLMFFTGCSADSIMRVADRQEIAFPEFIDKVKGYRLIFVGEIHDKKWTHDSQLKVIRALHEAGVPLAVGLEMFTTESQKDLSLWNSGQMDVEDFKKLYRQNWQVPWRQYRDIFIYAKDNNIPLVGLNVPRSVIHQVFTKGFKSLMPEQLKELKDVTCDVDEAYENFIREAMEEHEMKDADFKNFCEAQMVWDTSMANRAVEYLKENPSRSLVVLAGSGHSWKRGIPAQVSKRSDLSYLVLLPESNDQVGREGATSRDADYLWLKP